MKLLKYTKFYENGDHIIIRDMKHFYEWQKAVLEMRNRRIIVYRVDLLFCPEATAGRAGILMAARKKLRPWVVLNRNILQTNHNIDYQTYFCCTTKLAAVWL